MRRAVFGVLLAQIVLASVALADPGALARPSPAVAPLCEKASPAVAGNALDGAVFLAPPNGCASICSAANGQSCSPQGKIKSCFDVNDPDICHSCICTASLVWSCG